MTHIKINKLTKMMTDMNMETILVVMNTPWEVVKIRPEKKSGLFGIMKKIVN